MRKKNKQSVDPAPVDAAWQAFFDSQKLDDADELKAQGWRTIDEILLEIGEDSRARQRIDQASRRGMLEKTQASIFISGKRRKINFYRPKVS